MLSFRFAHTETCPLRHLQPPLLLFLMNTTHIIATIYFRNLFNVRNVITGYLIFLLRSHVQEREQCRLMVKRRGLESHLTHSYHCAIEQQHQPQPQQQQTCLFYVPFHADNRIIFSVFGHVKKQIIYVSSVTIHLWH